MKELAEGLSKKGYSIERNVQIPDYNLALLAKKARWELSKVGKITRFILAVESEDTTQETVRRFSKTATKYVLENWKKERSTGFFSKGILCIPLIVAENVRSETKAWLNEYTSDRHWLAYEFPVLFSLSDRQISYSEKTPTWGRLYYKGFRKFAEENLRLS